MSQRQIPSQEMRLLREVVAKHQPSLVRVLDQVGVTPLSDDQREALREALAHELTETGLEKNDEPNERGRMLDDLIGRLGRL